MNWDNEIDDVARRLTARDPHGGFEARVMARIEAADAARPLSVRGWVTVIAACAIVLAGVVPAFRSARTPISVNQPTAKPSPPVATVRPPAESPRPPAETAREARSAKPREARAPADRQPPRVVRDRGAALGASDSLEVTPISIEVLGWTAIEPAERIDLPPIDLPMLELDRDGDFND
jgi:hypothetical protein